MTLEISIKFPALDHLADVLERCDLRAALAHVALTPVVAETREAEAPAGPLPEIPAVPEPIPEPEPAPEPEPEPEPAPEPEPKPKPESAPEPVALPDMSAIRRASAALRDAGKLAEVQQLLKACGAKNLSALKPDQLAGFVAGLRELGAKL